MAHSLSRDDLVLAATLLERLDDPENIHVFLAHMRRVYASDPAGVRLLEDLAATRLTARPNGRR